MAVEVGKLPLVQNLTLHLEGVADGHNLVLSNLHCTFLSQALLAPPRVADLGPRGNPHPSEPLPKGYSGGMRVEGAIGKTPVVRLAKVVEPDMAEVWVKLEGLNPGGSIKDRPAWYMIKDAEERGILRPGSGQVIVEPTSGNTGIGLAMIAASRGYRLILTMPAQMSEERKRVLKAFGAELVLTDPERRMLAAREEALRLKEELGAFMPDQFKNPANVRAHYETTGPELYEALEGRIDAFVYGSGTGGTITGVGRYLKERIPHVKVIAVEPARSNVLSGGKMGQHGFQGMGPGFIPENLDLSLLDGVIQVWEEDAFPLARRLAREEGLFLGMSSGGIVWAALQVARELGPGKRVACISPDGGWKYLSTPFTPSPRILRPCGASSPASS